MVSFVPIFFYSGYTLTLEPKLIRFELRFLIRWIWFSKQVITMRISVLPFDLEFSILNHLWALRINLFKVDETISFGGDDVSVTT